MTSSPMLCSVLTSSQDQTEDFLSQLRNHLQQIETNVQQNLTKIQQRQPFTLATKKPTEIDENLRTKFLHVLKDVANKNNLPFDEPFYRQQVLDTTDVSPSPKVEIVREKISLLPATEMTSQPLSPVNDTRRSQFAPVLSSTPVHQTSPTMPIPVDLTMATPSVAPTYTMTNNDLPAVPPSAIVPQRAATRPPRLPRAESASRQKKRKDISTVQEQPVEEELIIVTSKRRIETKEENNQIQLVVIEQENTLVADVVKTVQATPLRGRKKKTTAAPPVEEPTPELEPPAPKPVVVAELPPKPSRAGRGKKKEQDPVTKPADLPTRTSSSRTRKKQENEEVVVVKEVPSEILPKKTTRSRKKTEEIIAPPPPPPTTTTTITKTRSTPSRKKKKSSTTTTSSSVEVSEPIVSLSPKRTNTRSKKRKENEDQIEENPVSKRRFGGRRKKSVEAAAAVATEAVVPVEPANTKTNEIAPVSTRSSTRGKKEVEIPIEKQDEIVLKKKTRSGRGKKTTIESSSTVVAVDIPIPTSISMDSIVSKPPRPPVARKKKSIAMPPISQMSPTTPPSSAQRIQSTSPIRDAPLLPLPVVGRRRPAARRAAAPTSSPTNLDVVPSTTNRNQKRSQSSAAATPKRARRENLIVMTVLGTPGKKRNKCTCEKRGRRVCDICATAVDG